MLVALGSLEPCDELLCFLSLSSFFFLVGLRGVVLIVAVALSHHLLITYFFFSYSMRSKMKCSRADT